MRWSRRPPAAGKVPGTGEGLTFIWQPQPRTEVAFGATAAPSDLDEPPVPHQETVSVKKKKRKGGKKIKKGHVGVRNPKGRNSDVRVRPQKRYQFFLPLSTACCPPALFVSAPFAARKAFPF